MQIVISDIFGDGGNNFLFFSPTPTSSKRRFHLYNEPLFRRHPCRRQMAGTAITPPAEIGMENATGSAFYTFPIASVAGQLALFVHNSPKSNAIQFFCSPGLINPFLCRRSINHIYRSLSSICWIFRNRFDSISVKTRPACHLWVLFFGCFDGWYLMWPRNEQETNLFL